MSSKKDHVAANLAQLMSNAPKGTVTKGVIQGSSVIVKSQEPVKK